MKTIFRRLEQKFERLVNTGAESLETVFAKEVHHIVITGLSRSGKSMFFTSLMSLLGQRSQVHFDSLPLLKSLPQDLVQNVELKPIADEQVFPLDESLQRLQSGQWPDSTKQIYGFELYLTLRPNNVVSKALRRNHKVVFRFYDYPGEWLTDLPMLHKTFLAWSDSAWSQQLNPPQKFYATAWHDFVEHFNFDLLPNAEHITTYLQAYRHYLSLAKTNGISLLQPGSMLMPSSGFDWNKQGFAPLPSHITSDPNHPWAVLFERHFDVFKQEWLAPLQKAYFSKADKQIIMLDLHEGLSHSRAHLNQLKETISNLSSSFVYGAQRWYKPKILFKEEISKVAFVASKVDLIPAAQQANFMLLLQDITAGIRGHLQDQDVEFSHFLVSAIQTTDRGECENCLRFTNLQGDYEEWEFADMPSELKALDPEQNYPQILARVPKDVLPRMNHAQGIDRLIDYLIMK